MYESSCYQTVDARKRCINAATVTTFLIVPVLLHVPTVHPVLDQITHSVWTSASLLKGRRSLPA